MASITTLPTYETKSFARWVAQATEKYFENEEVQKRFENWKNEKAKMKNSKYENVKN